MEGPEEEDARRQLPPRSLQYVAISTLKSHEVTLRGATINGVRGRQVSSNSSNCITIAFELYRSCIKQRSIQSIQPTTDGFGVSVESPRHPHPHHCTADVRHVRRVLPAIDISVPPRAGSAAGLVRVARAPPSWVATTATVRLLYCEVAAVASMLSLPSMPEVRCVTFVFRASSWSRPYRSWGVRSWDRRMRWVWR